jgi:hypothetical protein
MAVVYSNATEMPSYRTHGPFSRHNANGTEDNEPWGIAFDRVYSLEIDTWHQATFFTGTANDEIEVLTFDQWRRTGGYYTGIWPHSHSYGPHYFYSGTIKFRVTRLDERPGYGRHVTLFSDRYWNPFGQVFFRYEPACNLTASETPPPPPPSAPPAPFAAGSFDGSGALDYGASHCEQQVLNNDSLPIVVVGLGDGGAAAAARLRDLGEAVVVLEAGDMGAVDANEWMPYGDHPRPGLSHLSFGPSGQIYPYHREGWSSIDHTTPAVPLQVGGAGAAGPRLCHCPTAAAMQIALDSSYDAAEAHGWLSSRINCTCAAPVAGIHDISPEAMGYAAAEKRNASSPVCAMIRSYPRDPITGEPALDRVDLSMSFGAETWSTFRPDPNFQWGLRRLSTYENLLTRRAHWWSPLEHQSDIDAHLEVHLQRHVQRVLFAADGATAIGVFHTSDQAGTAGGAPVCAKGVVLAAGAAGSARVALKTPELRGDGNVAHWDAPKAMRSILFQETVDVAAACPLQVAPTNLYVDRNGCRGLAQLLICNNTLLDANARQTSTTPSTLTYDAATDLLHTTYNPDTAGACTERQMATAVSDAMAEVMPAVDARFWDPDNAAFGTGGISFTSGYTGAPLQSRVSGKQRLVLGDVTAFDRQLDDYPLCRAQVAGAAAARALVVQLTASPPPPMSGAHCEAGYWPLYATADAARAVSPLETAHEHEFHGATFYMPDGFVGATHGELPCPSSSQPFSPPPAAAPPPMSGAHCEAGYWPLYATANAARAMSPLETAHEHEFHGATFYMPDEFVGATHGELPCPAESLPFSPPPAAAAPSVPGARTYNGTESPPPPHASPGEPPGESASGEPPGESASGEPAAPPAPPAPPSPPAPPAAPASEGLSDGAIAGIAVGGGVVGLALVGVAVWMVTRARKPAGPAPEQAKLLQEKVSAAGRAGLVLAVTPLGARP